LTFALPGVHLKRIPVNYAPDFFLRSGGARAPSAPLATPMGEFMKHIATYKARTFSFGSVYKLLQSERLRLFSVPHSNSITNQTDYMCSALRASDPMIAREPSTVPRADHHWSKHGRAAPDKMLYMSTA